MRCLASNVAGEQVASVGCFARVASVGCFARVASVGCFARVASCSIWDGYSILLCHYIHIHIYLCFHVESDIFKQQRFLKVWRQMVQNRPGATCKISRTHGATHFDTWKGRRDVFDNNDVSAIRQL
jgi:hypothetical protein